MISRNGSALAAEVVYGSIVVCVERWRLQLRGTTFNPALQQCLVNVFGFCCFIGFRRCFLPGSFILLSDRHVDRVFSRILAVLFSGFISCCNHFTGLGDLRYTVGTSKLESHSSGGGGGASCHLISSSVVNFCHDGVV